MAGQSQWVKTILHNSFNPLPLLQIPGEPSFCLKNAHRMKILDRSYKVARIPSHVTYIQSICFTYLLLSIEVASLLASFQVFFRGFIKVFPPPCEADLIFC